MLTLPAASPSLPSECPAPALGPRGGSLGRPNQAGDTARERVRCLLGLLYPTGHAVERRREQRYPFPLLVQLTPVDAAGKPTAGETIVAAGKQISECGLGFYHPAPLPYRRVLATVEGMAGQTIEFQLDLSWCRFLRQGWYESGGRFIEAGG